MATIQRGSPLKAFGKASMLGAGAAMPLLSALMHCKKPELPNPEASLLKEAASMHLSQAVVHPFKASAHLFGAQELRRDQSMGFAEAILRCVDAVQGPREGRRALRSVRCTGGFDSALCFDYFSKPHNEAPTRRSE